MSLFNLSEQIAVITGASSGLGRHFALTLAKQGADIVVITPCKANLADLAVEIETHHVNCLIIACDLAQNKEVIDTVKQIIDVYGKVDILINASWLSLPVNAQNVTRADFDKVIDINMRAVFFLFQEIGRNMTLEKYGRIINIASIYGQVGNEFSGAIAYHSSIGSSFITGQTIFVDGGWTH